MLLVARCKNSLSLMGNCDGVVGCIWSCEEIWKKRENAVTCKFIEDAEVILDDELQLITKARHEIREQFWTTGFQH